MTARSLIAEVEFKCRTSFIDRFLSIRCLMRGSTRFFGRAAEAAAAPAVVAIGAEEAAAATLAAVANAGRGSFRFLGSLGLRSAMALISSAFGHKT